MLARTRSFGLFSRSHYIHRDYQLMMVLKFCALAFVGTALFSAIFYFMLNRDVGGSYSSVLDGMRFLKTRALTGFIISEGVAIAVLAVGVTALTLFMSHRIAGPLWRIEQTAKAVGKGRLDQVIKLREKDEIKSLAGQMNSMMNGLALRLQDIRNTHTALEKELELLARRSESSLLTDDEFYRMVKKIIIRASELNGKFTEIKL